MGAVGLVSRLRRLPIAMVFVLLMCSSLAADVQLADDLVRELNLQKGGKTLCCYAQNGKTKIALIKASGIEGGGFIVQPLSPKQAHGNKRKAKKIKKLLGQARQACDAAGGPPDPGQEEPEDEDNGPSLPIFSAAPFDVPRALANFFDHNLPFQFTDTNGFLLTRSAEQTTSGIDGHQGYDWDMPNGTPLYAVADGTISYAGLQEPLSCPLLGGQMTEDPLVNLDVTTEGGQVYVVRYLHLQSMEVETGQEVHAGDLIGYSGDIGCSLGPHLHFDVFRQDGERYVVVDPYGWRGDSTDPWSSHPDGSESLYLWQDGVAPLLYRGFSQEPNPRDGDASPVAITMFRWMGELDAIKPNNEIVRLEIDTRFSGGDTFSLAGFTLHNNAGDVFTFPAGAEIHAGQPIDIYSGSGTSTATSYYWGNSSGVWNNDADCARLLGPGGDLYYSFFTVAGACDDAQSSGNHHLHSAAPICFAQPLKR